MYTPLYYAQDRLFQFLFSRDQEQLEPKVWTPLVLRLWNFRNYTTRSCLVICIKTIANFVPLKKSYLETLNQYLNNILNGHSIQFLKPLVQNIEENITIRAAIFRLKRDESSTSFPGSFLYFEVERGPWERGWREFSEFSLKFFRMWRHFCWMIQTQKLCQSL